MKINFKNYYIKKLNTNGEYLTRLKDFIFILLIHKKNPSLDISFISRDGSLIITRGSTLFPNVIQALLRVSIIFLVSLLNYEKFSLYLLFSL